MNKNSVGEASRSSLKCFMRKLRKEVNEIKFEVLIVKNS